MAEDRYDLIVIGSGSAGSFAAREATSCYGRRVAVVEKHRWGGDCMTVACKPTKTYLTSAELYHDVRARGPELGVFADGVRLDFRQVKERKDAFVAASSGEARRRNLREPAGCGDSSRGAREGGSGGVKAAIVVLAGAESREGLGRVVNALTTAREFDEHGDEVVVVFDGAGTTWIPLLSDPPHRYHELFESVRAAISGACAYCAAAYGVKDEVEAAEVKLLDEYAQHPSLRRLMSQGFHVVTF